jgi:hypothetical protein
LGFCLACSAPTREVVTAESPERITITQLVLDTIWVQPPKSSGVGRFYFAHDSVFFADQVQVTVAKFTKTGHYVATHLGQGNGPTEVPRWQHLLFTDTEVLVFENYKIYAFGRDWRRRRELALGWPSSVTLAELEANPQPDYAGMYEVRYEKNHYAALAGKVLLNVETTHPKFNGFFANTAPQYYAEARIFGQLNPQTGAVEKIGGHYSDFYAKNPHYPLFSFWHYDTTADSVYLTFAADPLIYVLDRDLQPVRAFGRPGRNLRQQYRKTMSYDEIDKALKTSQLTEKGYYDGLKYLPKQGLLFRAYTTGQAPAEGTGPATPNPRRLQIYRGLVLVGDVPVPPTFQIIGADDQFVYADGFYDETNGKLGFYRFPLPQ